MLHIIRSRATPEQIDEMLEALGLFIKLAVDIRRGILAGGGGMHAFVKLRCSKMAASKKIYGVLTGILPRSRSSTNRSSISDLATTTVGLKSVICKRESVLLRLSSSY